MKINDLDGYFEYSKIINLASKRVTNVKIYPSVTSGILTIEGAQSVNIVNSVGQVVRAFPKANIFEKVDISALPNGVYIVKGINTEGSVFSEKIVKQ